MALNHNIIYQYFSKGVWLKMITSQYLCIYFNKKINDIYLYLWFIYIYSLCTYVHYVHLWSKIRIIAQLIYYIINVNKSICDIFSSCQGKQVYLANNGSKIVRYSLWDLSAVLPCRENYNHTLPSVTLRLKKQQVDLRILNKYEGYMCKT